MLQIPNQHPIKAAIQSVHCPSVQCFTPPPHLSQTKSSHMFPMVPKGAASPPSPIRVTVTNYRFFFLHWIFKDAQFLHGYIWEPVSILSQDDITHSQGFNLSSIYRTRSLSTPSQTQLLDSSICISGVGDLAGNSAQINIFNTPECLLILPPHLPGLSRQNFDLPRVLSQKPRNPLFWGGSDKVVKCTGFGIRGPRLISSQPTASCALDKMCDFCGSADKPVKLS